MKLNMFQVVRLKTKEKGTIVEIFNEGEGYIVDIRLEDDSYEQRTVYPHEITSVFEEVEREFIAA